MKKYTRTCLIILIPVIFFAFFISHNLEKKKTVKMKKNVLEAIEKQVVASFDIASFYAKEGAIFISSDPKIQQIIAKAYALHNNNNNNNNNNGKKKNSKSPESELVKLYEKTKELFPHMIIENNVGGNIVQSHLHIVNESDKNKPISFVRFHDFDRVFDKRRDYLFFRKNIIKLHNSKDIKSISGIEIGVGGLGIRGIASIFKKGKLIGSFEFGMNHIQLIEKVKEANDVDIGILLDGDKIKDIPQPRTGGLATAFTKGDMVYFNSDKHMKVVCETECFNDLTSTVALKTIEQMRKERKGKHYSGDKYDVYINPFKDANGSEIGFIFIMKKK